MTRETKIGLLVGLAFILVVGILLSEHLTSATERPAAALAEAGRSVQTALSTPGSSGGYGPTITRATSPTTPVPTAEELNTASQTAVARPPEKSTNNNNLIPLPPRIGPHGNGTAVASAEGAEGPARTPMTISVPDPFANDPLLRTARAHGETLVPVPDPVANPVPAAVGPSVDVARTTPTPGNSTAGTRQYVAQTGDTLSRLAALLPGGNTRTNRDAVAKLNPTLSKDPNKIFAGRTYLLPTTTVARSEAPAVAQPKSAAAAVPPPLVQQASTVAITPEAGSTRTYVVQRGDTLSKIASEQFGSVKNLPELRKMNESILNGGDVIHVDMKLKVPSRSVAVNQ